LEESKRQGKCIFGLGAPVKGNTLLNYFQIDRITVEVLVEKNPLRRGLYSPGRHIPIVMEAEIQKQPDIYYVLAWNFKKEIMKNYASVITQGTQLYFPIHTHCEVAM
jgi:hypothetical protein